MPCVSIITGQRDKGLYYKADLRKGVAVEYVSCEPSITARELFGEDTVPVEDE